MKILYLLLASSAHASFTIYPNTVPESTDDYAVVNAYPNVTLDAVFTDVSVINAGAVVNASTGEVVYVLRQIRTTGFKGDIGTLNYVQGLDYHELVTWKLETQVYVARHFGLEEEGALVEKSQYRCLKSSGTASDCASMKRCVGIIEGHCLLSSVPQDFYTPLPGIMRMRLKITSHDIYEWFKENVAAGILLLMLTQSGLLFVSRWSARNLNSR